MAVQTVQAQRFLKSTARNRTEIDTLYPYDILLQPGSAEAADTTRLTSGDLLCKELGKRPVVLLFWMTTCGPCRMELAEIEKRMADWQERYDVAFIPISLDFSTRKDDFVTRAADYPWTSYWDVNREFPRVMPGGLNGVPQLFVFDKEGQQVLYQRKYRPQYLGELEAKLDQVAKKK